MKTKRHSYKNEVENLKSLSERLRSELTGYKESSIHYKAKYDELSRKFDLLNEFIVKGMASIKENEARTIETIYSHFNKELREVNWEIKAIKEKAVFPFDEN